ncbi:MAG: hypothetical protein GY856_23670 [bacterium]|nr:hypothetical protein [bacterium]
MGQVVERVKIRSFVDMFAVSRGTLDEEEIRTVETDAVVDTGSSFLCLPPALVEDLGLLYSHSQPVQTANGAVERRIFSGARIEIRDRHVQMDVMENDSTTPALVGYLVLEALDFVIDPKARKLIPNPKHDGKWILDLL